MASLLDARSTILAAALLLGGCLPPGTAAADPGSAADPPGHEPEQTALVPAAPAPGAPTGGLSLRVGDFSAAAWPGWENVTYFPWSPKVDYRRERGPDGEDLARAISRDAGSMFMRRVSFDLARTPIVRWRWRVPGPIAGANERVKETDDAAARVYFVWGLRDKGDLFRAEALGYIWGRTRRAGEIGRSPFSERIGIVCLRAGRAGAGAWQEERRDLAADYRAYFKRAPAAPVTAVAILTDTDDTNGAATATYGPIYAEAAR